ncbi:MAG: Kelch repeat-containing protein [Planctomycetota bacterium]
MRFLNLSAATALLTALAITANPANGQQLTLDVSGGILGENWNFTVTGGEPGDFWVIALADTTGPTPINLVLGDGDPRNFDLDLSMFSYPGSFGILPAVNPVFQFPNIYAPYIGVHVYAQAFTLYGNPYTVDSLSNNVVIVVAPGHGASVDTVGDPTRARAFMPGVKLTNGDHVIFGGNDGALQGGTYLKSNELFNRQLQFFSVAPTIPDLSIERSFHQGLALNDGRFIITGGNDDLNNTLTSTEIYDPTSNTFSATGSMNQKRYFHSIVKLNDGRVMVLGGSTAVNASGTPFDAALAIVNSATDICEIYDPSNGVWTQTANMPWKRTGLSAATLPNGRVLACMGAGSFLGIPVFSNNAAIYNPATNTWQTIANATGTGRALCTTTTLNDGKIMVSGGANGSVATLTLDAKAAVSIYDPVTNAWLAGVPTLLTARAGHVATIMPDGTLIMSGGASGNVLAPSVTTAVDKWDGVSWTTIGNMNHERAFHYAGLSHDGERIFLFGGIETGGTTSGFPTAEFFAP